MSAGGVRADIKTMETRVPGLFIAGPVGGHTLGGLNFASHDGLLAGRQAASRSRRVSLPVVDEVKVRAFEDSIAAHLASAGDGDESPIRVKNRIRNVVWEQLMFVKSAPGLEKALRELEAIEEEMVPRMRLRTSAARYNTDLVDALDVHDMLQVAAMVIHAALARKESRGPHFREDFPFTDNKSWLKYVVVSREDKTVRTRLEPARQKYVRPEPEVLDYFDNPYA